MRWRTYGAKIMSEENVCMLLGCVIQEKNVSILYSTNFSSAVMGCFKFKIIKYYIWLFLILSKETYSISILQFWFARIKYSNSYD